MTFNEYLEIIKVSIADQGYDRFFPSGCIDTEDETFCVLHGDLSDAGEEIVAKEWVASLPLEVNHVFLAYRAGNREVHVCEIQDRNVINKIRIAVTGANA